MKRYSTLLLLVSFVLMVGCASLNAPIERQVVDNTFHSERFPKINIKVSDELQFISHKQEKEKPETDTGAIGSRDVKIDKYLFVNKKNGNNLLIKIKFMLEYRWSFFVPDYSTLDGILKYGDEKLLGTRYSTGIFPFRNPKGTVSLVKVWARAVGESTLFQIFYGERVDQSWADVNRVQLNAKQKKFLKEFDKRAARSFEVIP